MKQAIPEKKKFGKRAVMDTLAKKAVEERDKLAKKARKEITRGPTIPGCNRAMIRKYVKQQKKVIKQQQKREAHKAREEAENETNND